MGLLQLNMGEQEQRGTVNGGLSPGLLSRRVTSTGGRQLSDQPLAFQASRNPSRPLQIVVPRTCDESCTGLLKRESCQVVGGPLGRGVAARWWLAGALTCVVLVRRRTAMRRSVRPKQVFQTVSKTHQIRFLMSDISSGSESCLPPPSVAGCALPRSRRPPCIVDCFSSLCSA